MVTPAPSLPKPFSQLSLTEAAELLAARELPPVETWNPARTGDSAMEIRAAGSWYHEGGRINRPAIDRKSGVWGERVSVRVDLGGRRSIKKKNNRKRRQTKKI